MQNPTLTNIYVHDYARVVVEQQLQIYVVSFSLEGSFDVETLIFALTTLILFIYYWHIGYDNVLWTIHRAWRGGLHEIEWWWLVHRSRKVMFCLSRRWDSRLVGTWGGSLGCFHFQNRTSLLRFRCLFLFRLVIHVEQIALRGFRGRRLDGLWLRCNVEQVGRSIID